MSKEQIADLERELSQQDQSDQFMLLEYQVRFWKQRAWRAEQQRDREIQARKEAELLTEKYKGIPQESLDQLVKEAELAKVKKEAEAYIKIGPFNLSKLQKKCNLLSSIDKQITFWKDIRQEDSDEESESE